MNATSLYQFRVDPAGWSGSLPEPLGPDDARGSMGHITYLDDANVVDWLRSRGLLDARQNIRITHMSGRAFAALVETDDGKAIFLKQPFAAIPPIGARREGLLLRMIAGREDLRGIGHVLPGFMRYDEADNVTVTVGLPNHRTLHGIGVPPPNDIVHETAIRLATLHTITATSRFAAEELQTHQAINPVPSYARITPEQFAHAPGSGFAILLAAMQALDEPLRAVRESWNPTCIIHGDFRDDNIMAVPEAGDGPRVVFIDWEMGGWGDPLWDLGALIGQWIYYWAESIKPDLNGGFAAWVRDASVPFARVQEATEITLKSYAESAGRKLSGPDGLLRRVVQLAGVFLLHRVLGSLESIGQIHTAAFYSLHLGRTLVGQPERASAVIARGLV